jgi:hypothetical protein
MNSLFSDTVDKIKRKAMSEMYKWMYENDKWNINQKPWTRRIRPAEGKEANEEKNNGRDKIWV